MKTIDWKDQYINTQGSNVSPIAKYYSVSSRIGAAGTREDPYQQTVAITNANKHFILSNGNFELKIASLQNAAEYPSIVGSGIGKTIANLLGAGHNFAVNISDMTVRGVSPSGVGDLYNQYWRRVYFNNVPQIMTRIAGGNMMNCIFKTQIACPSGYYSQCTYLEINTDTIYINVGLMIKCQVRITQSKLDAYKGYYWAFNNCAFIIGAESVATPLSGNNTNELRHNFVSRCTAQGLTVPSINDFGIETSVGRWIFSNNSISGDYETLQDSEIDLFAKVRGIYFGHTNKTVNQVPITTTPNIPASFTPGSGSETLVQNDSIGLLSTSNLTKRVNAYADSKIIWLGGLSKLTTLALTHNLPIEAGVCPDSVYGLSKDKVLSGSIESGNHYIIRSSNDLLATIKYNNVQYTSSLISRNNVFLGVANGNSFENLSGNAEIYQVLDFANHSSMQIRLMREIPSGNITSGNLQAGYWYFVEPNNLSDKSGTITYKGITRPAFDSFLVDSTNLTFTVNGTCHLRRCWKQDFDFGTETTDRSFWADRQKPNYFDVVSDDLRCLLKNNSSASVELATGEDGAYIGSGHPEFYNNINGVNGLKLPAYDVVGTYLQIRVPITTINPM